MQQTGTMQNFNRAVRLEKEGRLIPALKAYLLTIREDREHREAYLNLGSLYSRMNRLTEAMKCYGRAVRLGEDYLTFFNMGSILYKKGEYKKAVLTLEKSRRLRKDFSLSSLVMGLAYSRLKNLRAAESCFRQVLAMAPGNRVALTALALMYFDSGRLESSLELINRLMVMDGAHKKIRGLKAHILYRMNRLNETAAEIKTIKKSSQGYRVYDQFVKSVSLEVYTDRYGTMGDKITTLREKARDGEDREALISLSLCYLLKGDTDVAIDYLFEAKKRAAD